MSMKSRDRKTQYCVGDVIGHWTILSLCKHVVEQGDRAFRRTDFQCRCVCGEIQILRGDNLTKGRPKSCGCLRSGHGLARQGNKHPVYLAWQGMMTRCYNPRRAQWKDYGGRGIKVAEAWDTPEGFIKDMFDTWRPGLTLDRKDNDKDYSVDNCRWATRAEQQLNKRNSVMVDTPEGKLCLAEAARRYGVVSANAIWYRLRHGWEAHAALVTPRHPNRTGRPKNP